jgi:hypothetical protein
VIPLDLAPVKHRRRGNNLVRGVSGVSEIRNVHWCFHFDAKD